MTDPVVETDPTTSTDSSLSENSPAAPDAFQDGWKDVLEMLPEDLRPLVIEPLKEHDRKFQEVQTNWNSVKDIPEDYRKDPERVSQAMQVLHRLENDPYNVLKLMAENLGVTISEAQQELENQKNPEPVQNQSQAPVFTDDDDPRLKTMWDTIQRQNERWEQAVGGLQGLEEKRAQQALEQAESKKIDQAVNELVTTGKIPSDPNDPSVQQYYIGDLMMRAKIALDQGSKNPIADGFAAQQKFLGVLEQRQKATAPAQQYPLFMPTNGAAPANAPKPPDTSTEDGRLALMKQIAQASSG